MADEPDAPDYAATSLIEVTAFGDTTRMYVRNLLAPTITINAARTTHTFATGGNVNPLRGWYDRWFGRPPDDQDEPAIGQADWQTLEIQLQEFTHQLQLAYGAPPGTPIDDLTARHRDERARREAAVARARAEQLLLEHLSPTQRASYEKGGFFHVKGERLTYRLGQGGPSIDGPPGGTFCVFPLLRERLPKPDEVLAQKLFIEANEAGFLSVANWMGPTALSFARLHPDGTASAIAPLYNNRGHTPRYLDDTRLSPLTALDR